MDAEHPWIMRVVVVEEKERRLLLLLVGEEEHSSREHVHSSRRTMEDAGMIGEEQDVNGTLCIFLGRGSEKRCYNLQDGELRINS
jgi:hypothetical protein